MGSPIQGRIQWFPNEAGPELRLWQASIDVRSNIRSHHLKVEIPGFSWAGFCGASTSRKLASWHNMPGPCCKTIEDLMDLQSGELECIGVNWSECENPRSQFPFCLPRSFLTVSTIVPQKFKSLFLVHSFVYLSLPYQYRPPQAGDRVLVCIRPAGRCRSTRPPSLT